LGRYSPNLLTLTHLVGCQAPLISFNGVASVIDGDTIEIHGRRIRLEGIDAPERKQTCIRDGVPERCGQRAAFHLSDRIDGLVVSCEPTGTDRYERTLAICSAGGEDLNAMMVRDAWLSPTGPSRLATTAMRRMPGTVGAAFGAPRSRCPGTGGEDDREDVCPNLKVCSARPPNAPSTGLLGDIGRPSTRFALAERANYFPGDDPAGEIPLSDPG
jgi:hypothetical protein